jgi:ribose transport system substrate-binding protein
MPSFTARRGRLCRAARCIPVLGVIAAAAAGCGSDSDSTETGAESAKRSSATSEVGKVGTPDDFIDITKVCGTKEIVVGLADGFGGNAWRKITRAEAEDEARKCPNIKKFLYTDGQNNPQKAISDIDGLVAQGADVIITLADTGPALLPALRRATKAGVKVVPYIADPGGKPGVDYVDYVSENNDNNGVVWAEWMVKALKGEGNIVFLGGTPGNPVSKAEAEGIKQVVAKNPGIKLLAGPVDTNWDPAQTQKVMAGLLAKHRKIDGVISDYGGGSIGAIRAFLGANRALVPWATNDQNGFACQWKENREAHSRFQIATVSSRNWMSRVALRKGVAAAQSIADPEPSRINLPLVENSLGTPAPKCDSALSSDAILSTQLAPDRLKAVLGG